MQFSDSNRWQLLADVNTATRGSEHQMISNFARFIPKLQNFETLYQFVCTSWSTKSKRRLFRRRDLLRIFFTVSEQKHHNLGTLSCANVPQPCPCSKEKYSEHTLPLANCYGATCSHSGHAKGVPTRKTSILSHANHQTKQGIGSNFPDKSHL